VTRKERAVLRVFAKYSFCLAYLASLSTQSLNHFADKVAKAEALNALIASIHRGLAFRSPFCNRPTINATKNEADWKKCKNGGGLIPLSVFESLILNTHPLPRSFRNSYVATDRQAQLIRIQSFSARKSIS
jgi:hypothetical protein